MNISVALATYNGEKYILKQLHSILPQLQPDDEIILSDDGSEDKTICLVNSINDNRIRIITNPDKGITSNFQNAISHCNNDIIFLCDQDDVWTADKLKVIMHYFKTTSADLILSDAIITDEGLNTISPSFFKERNSGSGFLRNLIKNSYIGCCMAFRKELMNIILPIPAEIAMHDWWIGMLAELSGKVLFIPQKLMYYRRHDKNATGNKPKTLTNMLYWRIKLLVCIFVRLCRYRLKK